MTNDEDNGQQLRKLLADSNITQGEALARLNKRQVKPMALRTFKTYLAAPDSKTRIACPDAVLQRMKEILGVS